MYGLIASSERGWSNPGVIAPVSAGAVLLAMFVVAERHVRAPMMPLELFRSRTFTGVNLLTLLLYGALGAAFFFLPFLLIQARSYSATAAGVAYLPFTLVLAALSRWSGGLVDRFGARWPLITGPVIVACGFALLASDANSYYAVLLVMTLLGEAPVAERIASGDIVAEGDWHLYETLVAMIDPPDPNFAIVTP